MENFSHIKGTDFCLIEFTVGPPCRCALYWGSSASSSAEMKQMHSNRTDVTSDLNVSPPGRQTCFASLTFLKASLKWRSVTSWTRQQSNAVWLFTSCVTSVSPAPGVRCCHSVLRALPTGVPERSAALPAWPPEPGSTQALLRLPEPRGFNQRHHQRHHQRPPPGSHQQVHLSALSLALLWRFPQVPHVPVPLLHLWPSCPAHREVSRLAVSNTWNIFCSFTFERGRASVSSDVTVSADILSCVLHVAVFV